MPQKLLAMKYIRNNKRRVAVLLVSLSLFFVMNYVSQFLLSVTEETFHPAMMENPKYMQYLSVAGSSFGLDITQDTEILLQAYDEKIEQLTNKLRSESAISEVYYAKVIYSFIKPAIGQITIEVPLVEPEEVPTLVNHMKCKLRKGRMPKGKGEIVLDHASMLNNHYEVGDYLREDSYGKSYTIVGELDGDTYFGCGTYQEAENNNKSLVVLSDGTIRDFSKLLKSYGINIRKNYDDIQDAVNVNKWYKDEVVKEMDQSTEYIYPAITIILFISIFVVYTTYLRDRHNEWCLYSSIGYSRRTIYYSILRELLFTFGVSLLIGAFITILMIIGLEHFMIEPLGMRCRYFYPDMLLQMVYIFGLLLGLLQIPVQYALHKVRTIDAMED